MWLYLLIFFIPVFSYLSFNPGRNQHSSFLFLFLLGLSLFVGFSDMFGGYDRYIYGEIFDNIADITTMKGKYSESLYYNFYNSEFGYTFLNVLISFFYRESLYFHLNNHIDYLYLFIYISKEVYGKLSFSCNFIYGLMVFLYIYLFETSACCNNCMVKYSVCY